MQKLFMALCALLISGSIAATVAAESAAATAPLHHVVAFKFKPAATADQIKKIEDAFAALKAKIPQIVSLNWGTNISPEKLNKGFTHGFVLTFKNEKDRDAYLVHPEHKAFGGLVGPAVDDVFVLDFMAK
jgi:hypothetical protein